MSVSLIAKKAGVSIATVSRVLNNSRRVNPESADLVRKAVEELNLPPFKGRKRRSSSADKSTTIAIVSMGDAYLGWFGMPVIASIVAELTRAAESTGHGVLITEMVNPGEISAVLRRPGVEGAIIFQSESASTRDILTLKSVLPIVRVMGAPGVETLVDHVCIDNHAVGMLASTYLTRRGVKNPAFLSAHPSWPLMRRRGHGFLDTCADAGVRATCYLVSENQHLIDSYGARVVTANNIDDLTAKLLAGNHDGIFIGNDATTIEFYAALAKRGHTLDPKSNIVSCDNESIRISSLNPRPASVDLRLPEIARRAIEQLQYRIAHSDDYCPAVIEVSPAIVE